MNQKPLTDRERSDLISRLMLDDQAANLLVEREQLLQQLHPLRAASARRKSVWAGVGVGLAVLGALAMYFAPAEAFDTPLSNLRAYQISCPATALGISLGKSGDLKPVSSMMVWVNSATPVLIGGPDVASTLGMPICTDTAQCPASSISIDGKLARCLSTSGTVTATVLVGTL